MTYRGHVQGGVVVLDEDASLPEGTAVRIEIERDEDNIRTLREGLRRLAGTVQGLPFDMARNHDHYIHGAPRQT